jgi:hypothetical protein
LVNGLGRRLVSAKIVEEIRAELATGAGILKIVKILGLDSARAMQK